MLAVILIVTSSQLPNFKAVLGSLVNQTRHPDCIVCVFEGSDQDYEALCITAGKDATCLHAHHSFMGFSAGANRDVGISFCRERFGVCDFIFIDGDCLASPRLVEEHASVLHNNVGVVSCGFRYNRTKPYNNQYTLVPDRRLKNYYTKHQVFIPNMNAVAFMPYEILNHDVVWSCNLGVNAKALENIRMTTQPLSTNKSRYFCDVFDGKWGGEDTLLGLAGFRSGCVITTLDPSKSWVEHIWHPTTHHVNDNLMIVEDYDKTMLSYMTATSVLEVSRTNFECLQVHLPSQLKLVQSSKHCDFITRRSRLPIDVVNLLCANVLGCGIVEDLDTPVLNTYMFESLWYRLRQTRIEFNSYLEATA